MKKYLINGVLALFAGIYLASCADTETDYVPIAEQKVRAFDEVFKEIYGEIDPHQDWGFGSGKVEIDPNDSSQIVEVVDVDADVAFTRAAAFGHSNAQTRTRSLSGMQAGANKNRNLWAATDGQFNLLVPTPLTEGQKNRVRAYFQTHRYLTWETPNMTNYFVQQVYTGGTNTTGSLSTEIYTSANGASVTGGQHMDYLTIGDSKEHVLDFNAANNVNTASDVLNNLEATNSNKFHSDQITLMIGIPPTNVGYKDSEGSVQHLDCMALVGAKTIDDWARNAENYVNGQAIGEDVWYGKDQYDYQNSFWNRSFVGLDYEQTPVKDIYDTKNGDEFAKVLDFCSDTNNTKWVLYNGQYVAFSSITNNYLLNPEGNKVHWVKDNTNEYLGTNLGTNQNTFNKQATINGQNEKYYDLDAVYECINQGALPKVNNMEFIKNLGGRDYIYSDWIVTLASADLTEETDEDSEQYIDIWKQIERGRVFCEDLGRATREDLDFNDVVFDAIIFSNYTKYTKWKVNKVNGHEVSRTVTSGPTESTKYYANVKILAAGGTIPIAIMSNKDQSPSYQVHSQFVPAAPVDMMVNTRDNNSTAFGSYGVRDAVEIGSFTKNFKAEITNADGTKTEKNYTLKLFEIDPPSTDQNYIKEIKIWSSFGQGTQVSELAQVKGGAPQKFMVPLNTKWTSERKNISLAYPGFDAWVKNRSNVPDWANPQANYVYSGVVDGGTQLPLVMKATTSFITGIETPLWSGSQKYEENWSLANLPLTLKIDRFYPGDRLRFYGENIGEEAWITVVIGNLRPYFIDSNFPNYVVKSDGKVEKKSNGCIEVLLDESNADMLNNQIHDGNLSLQVQGRNFTLTRICRVLFQ